MRPPHRISALVAAILTYGGIIAPTHGAPLYSIIDLGTFGGSTSFALDVNNLGQVSGNAQTPLGDAAPRLNAFVWSPPGGPMNNIGVLPDSNNFSRGYAINDSGVVVGESDNNNSRAFRWDPVNGLVGLTRLAGDSDAGVAHDINNAGTIVGISGNGITSRPTMWINGVAIDLGSIDGVTTSFGRAWGINENGVAVGVTRTGVGTLAQAMLWDGTNVINLGSFQANLFSEAFAVNDANVAVGAAVNGTTPSGTDIRRAARWEIDDGSPVIIDLGSLGRTFSEAKDINNNGQIVGFATNISGLADVAWLWQDNTMVDLNTLIADDSGWILRSAEGINDLGYIVGYGSFEGSTRAYLLVPLAVSEPTGLALLGFAAGALAIRSRRQPKSRL